jgi:hypothetical protein
MVVGDELPRGINFWLVLTGTWRFYFPFHTWDVILPIDEVIFFKMVIAPPTRIRGFAHLK